MSIGLSGALLPAHPQPKPDEIFSSWFCRIAQANNLKLHTLEVQLWNRSKQIWTRDIDRSIDEPTLEKVASACGTPIERARETCLRSFEGKIFEKLHVNGNATWILPCGIFHRTRKRPGMQFCPLCLATDEVPYFRKTWRLALATFCDFHDVLLHDRCPKCQSPVMFHRQELGDRGAWKVESLTRCTTCDFDLKRSPAYQAPCIEIHAWLAMKSQLFFLENGWTFAGEKTFLYSHLYFDALRILVLKIRSSLTTGRLFQHACEKFSLDPQMNATRKVPFEFYDVAQRHCLLQIATWFLLEWPMRFLEIGKELEIRFSELMRDFDEVPFWFHEQARWLEIKPLGICDLERQAMRELWQQTHDIHKRKRLKKLLSQRAANRSLKGTVY